ncbi:MAG: DUF4954 family protein, partial [bacterium]|nr:DUF4954 family protein [bacterium]
MEKITKHPITGVEFDLVEGEDAFTHAEPLRAAREYRALDPAEVEMLIRNRNYAPDWNDVFVSEPFDTGIVQNCRFYGKVRLGVTMPMVLEFEGQRLPAGLYDSTFVSCEIGDHVAIHHAHYLAHCVVGDEVIIANAGRIMTTPRARFGAGGLKEGETADKRTWIDVGNARGGRRILPFPGMIAADAWLWSRFPHETDLTARLTAMTDVAIDPRHGIYSRIGRRAVIRDCQAIIDVFVGPEATIDGAVLLQNLNVRSAVNEKTWIGQGSILVDGIVGLGCRVEASQARRFVLGNCSRLLEGARLAHTFLGDNSTVAGCEMQNNLVFPNHEQHHSNSFLIAASLLGQSNVAAGATIGSNHNSRLDDGELLAGRGFWPGLCSSFKHPCRFASFTLAAKGDYPAELDVPLPFSLVATNEHAQCLAILPAYWFLYNMYAVVRNDWKFRARDRRIHRVQHIEYDSLAPDTIEEIFTAVELIERWTGDALLRKKDIPSDEVPVEDRRQMGRSLLRDDPETASELDILGEAVENSPRRAVVRKAEKAWIMYRDMVLYYAMRN